MCHCEAGAACRGNPPDRAKACQFPSFVSKSFGDCHGGLCPPRNDTVYGRTLNYSFQIFLWAFSHESSFKVIISWFCRRNNKENATKNRACFWRHTGYCVFRPSNPQGYFSHRLISTGTEMPGTDPSPVYCQKSTAYSKSIPSRYWASQKSNSVSSSRSSRFLAWEVLK